jgi:hypothetical protein
LECEVAGLLQLLVMNLLQPLLHSSAAAGVGFSFQLLVDTLLKRGTRG